MSLNTLLIVLLGVVALILIAVVLVNVLSPDKDEVAPVSSGSVVTDVPVSADTFANDPVSADVSDPADASPAADPLSSAGAPFAQDMPLDEGALVLNDIRTVEATPKPTPEAVSPRAALRPAPHKEGYLPIFEKAKTEEKIIAITVDDCFQFSNLGAMLNTCEALGPDAKITIFPIGKNVMKSGLQPYLRRAFQMGMQIENHSYGHTAFYKMDANSMAAEIFNQTRSVSYVLGVDYRMHFMRTRGGDNRWDLRTHQFIESQGYYGMAHWNVNGSKSSLDSLKKGLKPGNIYLFHTTDAETPKLCEFMQYAVSQGYKLVTLNEMFGYPENEYYELTDDPTNWAVPDPGTFTYEYQTLKKGDFLWEVNLLQQRLIELGWLDGTADGEYGQGTFMAVGYFQLAAGLEANGKASPETQEALFAADAPRAEDYDLDALAKGKGGKKTSGNAKAPANEMAAAPVNEAANTSEAAPAQPAAPTAEPTAAPHETITVAGNRDIDFSMFD